jgi:hypothetical protein
MTTFNTVSLGLSNDQLFRAAPSIFAEAPAASRSDKYCFIPTIGAINALRQEGFFPVKAQQTRSRTPDGREFARHVVRLRRGSDMRSPVNVGDSVPEIVLMNSHDGTSSYTLSAGVFRLVCSNGMVVADSEVGSIRVRHKGNILDDVIEGSYRIIEQSGAVFGRIEQFQQLALPAPVQEAFADAALTLKWDDGKAPVTGRDLLRARRHADDKNDLWTVYNRVQENLIKGGLYGRNANNRPTTTRPIKSIGEDIRVNKALWTLTEAMAKLVA